MEMLSRVRFWMTGFVGLLIPHVVSANGGIPLAIFFYPSFIFLFIPIIYVESYILEKRIGVDSDKALSLAFWSNLASTVAGIPLLYVAMGIGLLLAGPPRHPSLMYNLMDIAMSIVIVGPGLLTTYFQSYSENWAYYLVSALGVTVFLMIAFWMSYLIEFIVVKRKLKQIVNPEQLKSAVFWANVYSYILLWATTLILMSGMFFLERDLFNPRMVTSVYGWISIIVAVYIWVKMFKARTLGENIYSYIFLWLGLAIGCVYVTHLL